MSSKTVFCRLCLMINVPMHVLAGSPLQKVYETLTNVSLNKVQRPVVACYLCYYQLRKCHKLMVRAVRADNLLTQILHGDVVQEESISMIIRESQHLNNGLVVNPIDIISFSGNDDNLIEVEIKKEPLEDTEETETMRPSFQEHFEFDDSEQEVTEKRTQTDLHIKTELTGKDVEIATLDDEDVMREQLTDDKYTIRKELETLQVLEHHQPKGTISTEKYTQTRTEMQNSALTSDIEILGSRRHGPIVDEVPNIGNDIEILPSIKNTANIEPVSKYTCSMINNNSDIDCTSHNTNVNNSNSKQSTKIYTCDECGDMFWDEHFLIEHKEEHNADIIESNEKFGEGTTQEDTDLHQQSVSKTDAKKKYTEVLLYTRKKNFECEMCQRKFSEKSSLLKHLSIHNRKMRYECEICRGVFQNNGDLLRHMRIHSDERPFECEICRKQFRHKNNLKQHTKLHTGLKEFECKICNKRFVYKCNLKYHSLVHVNKEKSD